MRTKVKIKPGESLKFRPSGVNVVLGLLLLVALPLYLISLLIETGWVWCECMMDLMLRFSVGWLILMLIAMYVEQWLVGGPRGALDVKLEGRGDGPAMSKYRPYPARSRYDLGDSIRTADLGSVRLMVWRDDRRVRRWFRRGHYTAPLVVQLAVDVVGGEERNVVSDRLYLRAAWAWEAQLQHRIEWLPLHGHATKIAEFLQVPLIVERVDENESTTIAAAG